LKRVLRGFQSLFDDDGKSIRVQCWGSDRIVGAIGASATISLETDKGGADLSAEKIAVVTCGPHILKGHSSVVWSVAFSPDGKRLASGSQDNTIKLWDTVTGKELLTLKGHSRMVDSVAFSPDGKRLASAEGQGGKIKLWDTLDWTKSPK
jgi:WD40 repeat protein